MNCLRRKCLLLFLISHVSLFGFAEQGIITTDAGPNLPLKGAQATTQAIDFPQSVVADGKQGFYISSGSQNKIYRVAADGSISLIAGLGSSGFSGDQGPATAARLDNPVGMAIDSAGNLYIADTRNNRIRKVTPAGIISTVAGNGNYGHRGDGGPAVAAELGSPCGVAIDFSDNLYIADSHRIRKVSTAGIISTVAGDGKSGLDDGGSATAAHFDPQGIAVDSKGNLYISDALHHRIRKVTPAGIISTMAGNGTEGFSGDGGVATEAQLDDPFGVAFDSTGNLYISDARNNRIRKVTPAGIISTVAGNGNYGYSGDGSSAIAAELCEPDGLAVDSAGNLYIADTRNDRIRKVTTVGIISTVAGNGTQGFSGDGGLATAAQLNNPSSIAVDSAGNFYISDTGNNRIRKVTPAGIISTVVGNGNYGCYSGDGGPAIAARLCGPNGVAVDSAGNLYIADQGNNRIRKVTTVGIISTVAGNGTKGYSGDGGVASAAQLNNPHSVAVNSTGNLYIADAGNNRIRKVTPTGIISTVAGNGTEGFNGDGGPAIAAQLSFPFAISVDSKGNIYFLEANGNRIRKVTTSGIISIATGKGAGGIEDGETADEALLDKDGLAVDSAGNIYFAESKNHRICKVSTAGIISTVAGNETAGFSGDGGPATEAQLLYPTGLAVDFSNNLYIVDQENHRIRKVTWSSRDQQLVGGQGKFR
jgi:trimeric autotransporter adhesin